MSRPRNVNAETRLGGGCVGWSMDAAETGQTLIALRARGGPAGRAEGPGRPAHADDSTSAVTHRRLSAAAWLAHQTKTTRAAAGGAVRLGRDLEAHPATDAPRRRGPARGQARVVVRWVDRLPDTLPRRRSPRPRHTCWAWREHDATVLNRMGKHLFEVIAPEEADAHEAALLRTGGGRRRESVHVDDARRRAGVTAGPSRS